MIKVSDETISKIADKFAEVLKEWLSADEFAGAKKVMRPLPGKYSGNHVEPCRSCRDHAQSTYPNGYMD